ncbi:MAG: hypothetical protein AB1540_14430 [Bdellovibrionota bacterium]
MRCRYWLALIFAYLVFAPVASANPVVTAISADESQEFRSFITESGQRLIDPNDNTYRGFYDAIVALAQKLVIKEDGSKPIKIVLFNNLRHNAMFVQLENGDRVLGLNIGLLRFMESDDEIAFAIGHELEHGISKIQDYIKRLDTSNRGIDQLQVLGLQRAVENEVDVQSVLRRVHASGFTLMGPFITLTELLRSTAIPSRTRIQ